MSRFLFIALIILVFHQQIHSSNIHYDTIVFFGDSNSDQGNVYNLSSGRLPPPPYYQGRFSNRWVWLDKINISHVQNRAHAGATTDNDLIQGFALSQLPVPGVRQQIAQYFQSIDRSRINFDRTLFAIWAGGNNLLQSGIAILPLTTDSLTNATKDLIQLGVKHVLLFNQPPLEMIPRLQPLASRINISDLGRQYNRNMSMSINMLQNQHKDLTLKIFDLNELISKIYANGTFYGITNTKDFCFRISSTSNITCPDADLYLFVDDVHFTSRTHEFIAKKFDQFVQLSSSAGRHFPSLFFCLTISLFRFCHLSAFDQFYWICPI